MAEGLLDGRPVVMHGTKCRRRSCTREWTCRECKEKFCEHYCSLKDSMARVATCGRCQLRADLTVAWCVQVRKNGRWFTLDWAKNMTDQQQIENERRKAAAEHGDENVRVESSWEGKQ